ncbi:MAG: VWA domain-containing protein [Nitrososphaerota archaeon]
MGTIDVESLMKGGEKTLQPGLLAMANQGILYLDEVNLLPDHLVDTILDASASGWNIVEREGISASHPARFILVGSMNPEEGELRPQILDRFGLHAKTENVRSLTDRVEVIRRSLEFSQKPDSFVEKYRPQDEVIRERILQARLLLPKVSVTDEALQSVAKLHASLRVDGYRPDIVTIRAARALAAYNGRLKVEPDDIYLASELTLSHRTRDSGLRSPPSSREIKEAFEETPVAVLASKRGGRRIKLRRAIQKAAGLGRSHTLKRLGALTFLLAVTLVSLILTGGLTEIVMKSPLLFISGILLAVSLGVAVGRRLSKPRSPPPVKLLDLSRITSVQTRGPKMVVEDSDEAVRLPTIAERRDESQPELEGSGVTLAEAERFIQKTEPAHHRLRPSAQRERAIRGTQYLVGKRAKIVASSSRGRYVWHETPRDKPRDIAFGPTVRAAAPYQRYRRSDGGLAIIIRPEDIRVKMREYRAPFSIVLVVDMSLSMANSIINLGRAVFSLHRSVYRRRDRVSLVVFKGMDATILQQPTTNLGLIVKKLWNVGTSDFTPIASGMLRALRLLRLEKQRNKDVIPMMILISDGIANVPLTRPLTSRSRRMFVSKAQADVFDVAHLLKRSGVRTIVINTSHRRSEIPGEAFKKLPSRSDWFTPTEFLMEVSRVMGGSYYGISLTREPSMHVSKTKLDDWFYLESEEL